MKITIGMLLAVIATVIVLLLLDRCEKKPEYIHNNDTVEVIKSRIDTIEVEVVKLKQAKTKIIYRTIFDTLATIDTVLIELKKCDTIVKIDSVIIKDQETIIEGQEDVIGLIETDNKALQKQIKKEKRKLILTKIGAVAVIILTIIAVK